MSNTSKADLVAEIVKLCGEQGKPVPEGLEALKQLKLFDVVESLTGKPDPRRPGSGAVRATPASAPSAPPPALEVASALELAQEPEPEPAREFESESESDEAGTSDETPEPSAPAAKAAKPERYRVREAKLVHCLCGPLGALQEIRAVDLAGGQEELDSLFDEGIVEACER